jgi:hypothetical protein
MQFVKSDTKPVYYETHHATTIYEYYSRHVLSPQHQVTKPKSTSNHSSSKPVTRLSHLKYHPKLSENGTQEHEDFLTNFDLATFNINVKAAASYSNAYLPITAIRYLKQTKCTPSPLNKRAI